MNSGIGELINTASGRKPADLVLKNARIVNVFTGEILSGDIALAGGRIAGIGEYAGREELDLQGGYALPGFIDAHMHLESSMTMPLEYARAVLPRGTACVVADPHEIANVSGIEGIRFLMEHSRDVGLDIYFMLPSCVPATPFDSPGARLDAFALAELKSADGVLGLGELMDFEGTVGGREDILAKLELFKDRIIDGHAPDLTGRRLNAYAAAGVTTEHECGNTEEMLEKLRLGFYILIREGSAAKNLVELIKAVTPGNLGRCLFCTDDRHPGDILREGHIDNNIRLAVKNGLDPVSAVRMATLNAAQCYGLRGRGAIAPGYVADMVIVDDLEDFHIRRVFKNGKSVEELISAMTASERAGANAEAGKDASADKSPDVFSVVLNTVKPGPIDKEKLVIPMKGDMARVIRVKPGSLLTEKIVRKVGTAEGRFARLREDDPLKLAVVERHRASGRVGLGLLDGFGLRRGALASTVSHDSHNMIVAGDNDEDMLLAIKELTSVGGGITAVSGGRVLRTLPLPVAGLLSLKTCEEVNRELTELIGIARGMGVPADIEPFMTLSFLSLTVIPEIRLTDRGLFETSENRLIGITL